MRPKISETDRAPYMCKFIAMPLIRRGVVLNLVPRRRHHRCIFLCSVFHLFHFIFVFCVSRNAIRSCVRSNLFWFCFGLWCSQFPCELWVIYTIQWLHKAQVFLFRCKLESSNIVNSLHISIYSAIVHPMWIEANCMAAVSKSMRFESGKCEFEWMCLFSFKDRLAHFHQQTNMKSKRQIAERERER